MSGRAAWQQLKVPVTFTRKTCSQNSGVILTKRLKVEPIPALLTRMATGPSWLLTSSMAAKTSLPVSHVDRESDGRPARRADGLGGARRGLAAQIEDGHGMSVRREPAADGQADARTATGDDRNSLLAHGTTLSSAGGLTVSPRRMDLQRFVRSEGDDCPRRAQRDGSGMRATVAPPSVGPEVCRWQRTVVPAGVT